MNKRVLGGLLMFVAVVSIVFGVVCLCLQTGNMEKTYEYNGDAYTGIQNAAAQTANNVVLLHQSVRMISGFFFILCGLVLGAVGIAVVGALQDAINETSDALEADK